VRTPWSPDRTDPPRYFFKLEATRACLRKARADIDLVAMESHGRLRTSTCTRVEPFPNPGGDTPEERGSTRYLGTYLSFLGWSEQESRLLRSVRRITQMTSRMGADITQIRGIYQSILTAQVTAARIIMPASTVLTDTIRESIATSVRSCLGVHKSSSLASTEESASTFLGSETASAWESMTPKPAAAPKTPAACSTGL